MLYDYKKSEKKFLLGFKPDKKLLVSEWSDKYRVLSSVASAEAGRWRTDRTPYLREVMDSMSFVGENRFIQEVVFAKGSQIGGSEAGLNFVGWAIDQSPGPMLLVQPTDLLAKRLSKQRLDPMIEECPRLREKVEEKKSRDSANTMLSKNFPGGMIILTGSNSPTNLRSTPCRYIFFDEIDAYPKDAGGEGSPVELGEARARTFSRRKIIKVSTPTREGDSVIMSEYAETDMRKYFVPCPFCKHEQTIEWDRLKWDKDENGKHLFHTVHLECENCDEPIGENHKGKMLELGRWIPTNENPTKPRARGYHLSALYSPPGWLSWEEVARKWVKDSKNVQKRITFINTILGLPYSEKSKETPQWQDLLNRRESYDVGLIPEAAKGGVLVAGVDVQKDRLELVAYCISMIDGKFQYYCVDYKVFWGETEADPRERYYFNRMGERLETSWYQLKEYIITGLKVDGGTEKPFVGVGLDTGYRTNHAYMFSRQFSNKQIFCLKGTDRMELSEIVGKPRLMEIDFKNQKIKRGQFLRIVSADHLKSMVYERIGIPLPSEEQIAAYGYPAGFFHFPMLPRDFFLQLTAEDLVIEVNKKTGKDRKFWKKNRKRNEVLDCTTYVLACQIILKLDDIDSENFSEYVEILENQAIENYKILV